MQEQNFSQAVVSSSSKEDTVSKTKTIYDVSAYEIFWRNFLAGLARGVGGLVMYFVLIVVIGTIFTQFILPQLQPLLNTYTSSLNSLKSLQQYQQ